MTRRGNAWAGSAENGRPEVGAFRFSGSAAAAVARGCLAEQRNRTA